MRKPEPFQGRKHLVLVYAGIRLGVPSDTPSEEDSYNGCGAKFNFKIFPKN